MDRARFDMFRHQTQHERIHARSAKTSNRGHEPRFAASPLTPQPDGPVRIISMAMPDHAPPVAPRNHSLAGTTVVNSSQTRTRATMLALTSHYSATNAKHPRHAPSSPRWWGAQAFAATRAGGRPGSLLPVTGPPHCHHRPHQPLSQARPSGPFQHHAPSNWSEPARWNIGPVEGPRARLRAGRAQPGARRGA